MHEYHATERILNHAIEQAAKASARRITDAHFVIGEISTYTADSIQGAWEVLAKGTPGEGARLHFRDVAAEMQCMVCFTKYHPNDGEVLCPACGSVGAKVLGGEEFYMESLDVE